MQTTQSTFRTPADCARLDDWCQRARARSSVVFEPRRVKTRFGETQVWQHRTGSARPALVVLPGMRTSSLIWNLDDTLQPLDREFDLHLVEVMGQPSLSEGTTPDMRGVGYGEWLVDVLDALELERAFFAGASLGGLLQFKLAQVAPARIRAAVMMNPAGLAGVSFAWPVMWENLRPILRPTAANVSRFLQRIVFAGGEQISEEAMRLLHEYVLLALTSHRYRGRYPYRLSDEEVRPLNAPLHLILGAGDRLIPQTKTEARARALLPNLKSVTWLPQHGHGAEVTPAAAQQLLKCLSAELATGPEASVIRTEKG